LPKPSAKQHTFHKKESYKRLSYGIDMIIRLVIEEAVHRKTCQRNRQHQVR